MSEKVKNALLWLKNVFDQHHIRYQIVGGLAATIHGGSREVADIDVYIPKAGATKLLPTVESFISKPLDHYVEGLWDLEYFQLIYDDQKIEIGLSPGTKLFNRHTGQWVPLETNFDRSVIGSYQGVEVYVIPVSHLVAYKSLLDREVDRIDIAALNARFGPSD